ncbi:MAG: GNAT family N-acetyltransferase [Halopseudomonas sp.]|uniref:GNAT family N-acetyltransferase n=1 Tax=Halopseudomonas sp. TaxID=2901191 RepID=UPI003001D809
MRLREGSAADTAACVALFTASVHALTGAHYDAEQRQAWAPLQPDMDFWRRRLGDLRLLLAEDASGLLGFIGYAADGHIDMLFCAPHAARNGVASALYKAAEAELLASGVTRLYTEASAVAEPFFQRRGFSVVEQEKVVRGEVLLLRYRMHKQLP